MESFPNTNSEFESVDDTQKKREWLRSQQVELLFDKSYINLIATVLSALALVGGLWIYEQRPILIVWLVITLIVTVCRFGLLYLYQNSIDLDGQEEKWLAWFTFGVFISGLLWGIGGVILPPSHSIIATVITLLILGSLVVASIISYSIAIPTFLAFALPLTLPIGCLLILKGDPITLAIGMMVFIFLGLMLLYAIRFNKTLINMTEMQFYNAKLISSLDKEKRNIESRIKEKTKELALSENKFASAFRSSPDAIAIFQTRNGTIIDTNSSHEDLSGYKREDLIGKSMFELGIWYDPKDRFNFFKMMKKDGHIHHWQCDLVTRSGERRHCEISAEKVIINAKECIVAITSDITERKLTEIALVRTNRALKVLSQCNEILLRVNNEQELLEEICAAMVETGEAMMVAVGYAEHDENKSVRMVAHYGHEAQYLANANINWRDDNERGRGPVGIAIRSGQPYIVKDTKTNTDIGPWREAALERGYTSSVVLPLIINNDILGVLLIYSSTTDTVMDEELKLLITLANNMAYGIQAIRTEENKLKTEKELRSTENKFAKAIDISPDGVAITRVSDGMILEVNEGFTKIMGYSREEAFGKLTAFDLYQDKNYRTEIKEHLQKEGSLSDYEVTYLGKEGNLIHGLSSSVIFEIDGEPYIYTNVKDITERKHAEIELQKLSRAVEASSSAVIMTDSKGYIEYVNPRFSEITGYGSKEAMGKSPRTLLQSKETPESIYDDISTSIAANGEWKGEFRSRKKDGELFWDSCSISCVKNDNGEITHYIGIQNDISREYEITEQLNYQASHDALTGLFNRREFERRAEQLLSADRQQYDQHALCFMDLDQFKVVNDNGGHTAGDEMLRQLAQILQVTVRNSDTLARLGGDEFGVLMQYCSLEDAERVVNSLQNAIQNYQFIWEGQHYKVGVSIGLVAITETTSDLTQLLKEADAACYIAKDQGRNRIHIYNAKDSEILRRHDEMQWVTRISQAIEENRFCLYAQSIVPLNGSPGEHYELLIRMLDENGKIVSPAIFLPAAERYGLISKIDYWVIECAFTTLANNPEFLEKINFCSINLSGPSLTEPNILNFIIEQLNISGIDGEKICFEITETAAISNMARATKFISTLKDLGCRFALDDFGSGLSSFGYLKKLPINYLKIDGMFVKDIVNDPIDRAMVKSINEIGQIMGMQTIAEFVEQDEIKGMLRVIGVDYAQGYAINKPQPLEELLNHRTPTKDKSSFL